MKVYTINQALELEIHASQRSFLEQTGPKGWCDPRYIKVATSNDLKKLYREPYTRGMIIHSFEDITAHNMLYWEFKTLSK